MQILNELFFINEDNFIECVECGSTFENENEMNKHKLINGWL
jgi:hypothetical protein